MVHVTRPSACLIGGALVATMVLGSAVGAEAATKKKPKHHKRVVRTTRTVKLSYTGGCTADTPAGAASDTSGCSSFGGAGWSVPTRSGEKYVTVTIADATGQKVRGAFWTGSGANGHADPFCGADKDYQFAVGPVVLALDAVGATTACPGLATQGTVTLVFSNLP
jgi:hypothetical protein